MISRLPDNSGGIHCGRYDRRSVEKGMLGMGR